MQHRLDVHADDVSAAADATYPRAWGEADTEPGEVGEAEAEVGTDVGTDVGTETPRETGTAAYPQARTEAALPAQRDAASATAE